ncbi:hypothetical protein OO006_06430 [Prosthecochloris sp. SCSIO W1101]|nr:hypothetical protein [Prosthecochloris sp. SCSIO W1101]UZJ42581.1 hypothetical protein OO006_06430 [Prosthecochloris sp. SCSIO W1101]
MKSTPHAIEIAAGIKYCACSEVSESKGVNPQTVVTVVRMIARKRLPPDRTNASPTEVPSRCISLNLVSNTRLLLTTTPIRASMPKKETILSGNPDTACPMVAPTKPNGITDIITNGCQYDLSGTARRA